MDTLTADGQAAALVLGILLLLLPRRHALLPLLGAGCYMTLGQSLVVGGLHLYFIRILILFGLVRIVVRREFSHVAPTEIDRMWLAWLVVSCFWFLIFDGARVAWSERLGYFYDAVGVYILVRAVVRDLDDVRGIVRAAAYLTAPLAILFVVESITGANWFAVLGGVPVLSEVRNGHVRCQGPFKHAILAGTFGATMMPLFVGLWLSSKRDRIVATFATISSIVIVMTSGSSGAFAAFFIAVLGWGCWACRHRMRAVRWSLAGGVIVLAMVMKAPVWFLIDRISELLGGDGWYRSALIDSAIGHLDEWWLAGTGYTAHWMATGIPSDPDSADIVNEFVNQGVRGGLLALTLFVWLIARCFRAVGLAVRHTDSPEADCLLMWGVGCALLAHVGSFFSVTYFDQIIIFWYLTVGMAAASYSHRLPMTVRADAPERAGVCVQLHSVWKPAAGHLTETRALARPRWPGKAGARSRAAGAETK